jgi:hypothetical protein
MGAAGCCQPMLSKHFIQQLVGDTTANVLTQKVEQKDAIGAETMVHKTRQFIGAKATELKRGGFFLIKKFDYMGKKPGVKVKGNLPFVASC